MSLIHFRCWRPCEKQFHGPNNDSIDWNTAIPFQVYEKTPKATLQQCSGRRDRFGKWIFEGDIILIIAEQEEYTSYPDIRARLFIDDDLLWMLKDTSEAARNWGTESFIDYYEQDRMVVIGNIFEGVKTDKEIDEMFKKEDAELQKAYEEFGMDD